MAVGAGESHSARLAHWLTIATMFLISLTEYFQTHLLFTYKSSQKASAHPPVSTYLNNSVVKQQRFEFLPLSDALY